MLPPHGDSLSASRFLYSPTSSKHKLAHLDEVYIDGRTGWMYMIAMIDGCYRLTIGCDNRSACFGAGTLQYRYKGKTSGYKGKKYKRQSINNLLQSTEQGKHQLMRK